MKNAVADMALPASGFASIHPICRFTSKSEPTIRRWVKTGIFPEPVKIGPNSVAWRTEDVQAWARDPQAWRESRAAQ